MRACLGSDCVTVHYKQVTLKCKRGGLWSVSITHFAVYSDIAGEAGSATTASRLHACGVSAVTTPESKHGPRRIRRWRIP